MQTVGLTALQYYCVSPFKNNFWRFCSMVPESAIAPPEGLEPGLELAKFGAISAVSLFHMSWGLAHCELDYCRRSLPCSCKGMDTANVWVARSWYSGFKHAASTCKNEHYWFCAGFLQRTFWGYSSKSRVASKQALCHANKNCSQ